MNNLLSDILLDMRVELLDEFDKNFSDGGYFGKKWKEKRNGEASHLVESGKLSKSLRGKVGKTSVSITSSQPYAAIHNEGGEITVTRKMQRYFWAKYYKAGKKGKEAAMYKAMALKKVGSKIEIPQRQFVGDHQKIRRAIQQIVRNNLERYTSDMARNINNKLR